MMDLRLFSETKLRTKFDTISLFYPKDIKDGMAYLNEFYKPEIEFL